jgi:hypothetical protein
MKAFDTDLLTEILAGNPAYAERVAAVPVGEQAVPIVAIEEIVRGRLNVIRPAAGPLLAEPVAALYTPISVSEFLI